MRDIKVYVIGSLRNPNVPLFSYKLRAMGFDVFDDWYAAGPEADDYWKEYEEARGHNYQEALNGHAAEHVFSYDKYHLDQADMAILLLPAGKSGHIEFGYALGRGKSAFILLDRPDRWDVMYKFASKVFFSEEELLEYFSHMETIK